MNANFGIVDRLDHTVRGGKSARNEAISARALAAHLSDRQHVSDLLEGGSPDGVQILLGADNDPLFVGSAAILVPYSLGKRGTGTIGVVGPIRRDYATLMPRLEYFAAHLGRMMGELFDDTEALDFG